MGQPGQGVLGNGVRWVRNDRGHLWFGRPNGAVYPNDLAVVKPARRLVRLKPPNKMVKRKVPLRLGGGYVNEQEPDDWLPAPPDLEALMESGADPGAVLDWLLDHYAEAWAVTEPVQAKRQLAKQ